MTRNESDIDVLFDDLMGGGNVHRDSEKALQRLSGFTDTKDQQPRSEDNTESSQVCGLARVIVWHSKNSLLQSLTMHTNAHTHTRAALLISA